MATDLKVGQHVRALRSSNKTVSIIGHIVQINDDGLTVNMNMDCNENFIETVHVDDVDVLSDAPAAKPASPKSLTKVNGKAL